MVLKCPISIGRWGMKKGFALWGSISISLIGVIYAVIRDLIVWFKESNMAIFLVPREIYQQVLQGLVY
jgi:hypothetical protein